MEIAEKNIEVKKQARYYLNGTDPGRAEAVWFLIHGYGQLAGNFIKKFKEIDNGKNLLVAPEALSRFYTDGGFGKIGASWMTREERETEITAYVDYLNSLYEMIYTKRGSGIPKLNLFAFSQGTATACRWLQRGGVKADLLILWGGFLPPDFDLKKWNDSFERLLIVTGTEDNFFTPANLEKGVKELDSLNVNYGVHIYEGIHEMSIKEVNNFFKNVVRL